MLPLHQRGSRAPGKGCVVRHPGVDPGMPEGPGFTVPVGCRPVTRVGSELPGGPTAGRRTAFRPFGPGPYCLLPLVRPRDGAKARMGSRDGYIEETSRTGRTGASPDDCRIGLAGCFPTSSGHHEAHFIYLSDLGRAAGTLPYDVSAAGSLAAALGRSTRPCWCSIRCRRRRASGPTFDQLPQRWHPSRLRVGRCGCEAPAPPDAAGWSGASLLSTVEFAPAPRWC